VVLNPTAPDESGQAILVWRIYNFLRVVLVIDIVLSVRSTIGIIFG
jgi:hypothetical protein